MEISTVPVQYVNCVLRAAQRRGCDREQVLVDVGISPELLDQERARIPATSYIRFSDYLTEKLNDEACGLMQQRTKPGTFAMMCHAAINCSTLGQFWQRCAEFHALVNDCLTLDITRDGEHATYTISPQPGMVDEDEYIIKVLLGIAHRLASWAIGQSLILESVSIARERPSYANEYNFMFMAPIQFGQASNSLHFSANYLDMPIMRNDQELEQFLDQASVQLMSNPDAKRSLVTRVRTMIKDEVSSQFPEFETIAETFHLTTATLRRRLRAEGSSYQQIKDDIRRDTAIYHLSRGTLSMEQVAESVGFSEPTSFFRAFKRWTGVTPRAYIKNRDS
jgi:AraC-like DNA-binding protein